MSQESLTYFWVHMTENATDKIIQSEQLADLQNASCLLVNDAVIQALPLCGKLMAVLKVCCLSVVQGSQLSQATLLDQVKVVL